jgi:hypothetical protein
MEDELCVRAHQQIGGQLRQHLIPT